MNSIPTVLVVSKDPMLMYTRKLILGTYFYVHTAGRVSEAALKIASVHFDLIVLCDTLSDSETVDISLMAREQTPAPVMLHLVGPGGVRTKASTGRTVECPEPPLGLLKECADALGVSLVREHKSGKTPPGSPPARCITPAERKESDRRESYLN